MVVGRPVSKMGWGDTVNVCRWVLYTFLTFVVAQETGTVSTQPRFSRSPEQSHFATNALVCGIGTGSNVDWVSGNN